MKKKWIIVFVLVGFTLHFKCNDLYSGEVGATFLLRLNDILRQVDPNQKEQDSLLESRLEHLLGRAQKLKRDHHLSKQKGLKSLEKTKALEEEGRSLIREVLGMTELYLEGRLKSLKANREDLVDALMPKEERK